MSRLSAAAIYFLTLGIHFDIRLEKVCYKVELLFMLLQSGMKFPFKNCKLHSAES